MKQYYNVRYLGKMVKVVCAHSKWEAMDKICNENPHILRKSYSASLSRH